MGSQAIYLNGQVVEAEVPLTFTFTIQDPPNPAYLHLTNGKVIRVDELREYTNMMEYTVGRRTHHVSPHSINKITACLRNCIYGGGPSFNIVAMPWLPARTTARPPSR